MEDAVMLEKTQTTLTEPERKAVDAYDVLARNTSFVDTHIWVDRFMFDAYCNLPRSPMVIDVGCGYGRFVPLLTDLGIEVRDYIGIDPSTEQLKLARATYPELESQFQEGSIYMLADMYPERFDGFMLIAVLMHIPRSRMVEALRSLRGCLKTGALGLFSTPGGGGEVVNRQGIEITLYSLKELAMLFEEAEFEITDAYSPNGAMIIGAVSAR